MSEKPSLPASLELRFALEQKRRARDEAAAAAREIEAQLSKQLGCEQDRRTFLVGRMVLELFTGEGRMPELEAAMRAFIGRRWDRLEESDRALFDGEAPFTASPLMPKAPAAATAEVARVLAKLQEDDR